MILINSEISFLLFFVFGTIFYGVYDNNTSFNDLIKVNHMHKNNDFLKKLINYLKTNEGNLSRIKPKKLTQSEDNIAMIVIGSLLLIFSLFVGVVELSERISSSFGNFWLIVGFICFYGSLVLIDYGQIKINKF